MRSVAPALSTGWLTCSSNCRPGARSLRRHATGGRPAQHRQGKDRHGQAQTGASAERLERHGDLLSSHKRTCRRDLLTGHDYCGSVTVANVPEPTHSPTHACRTLTISTWPGTGVTGSETVSGMLDVRLPALSRPVLAVTVVGPYSALIGR